MILYWQFGIFLKDSIAMNDMLGLPLTDLRDCDFSILFEEY